MTAEKVPAFLGVKKQSLDWSVDRHLDQSTENRVDVAILGAPHGTPYIAGARSHSADAPAAIRRAMGKFANWHDHYDFDTGHKLIDPRSLAVADFGDIEGDPADAAGNRAAITGTVRDLLDCGAVPIVLGGDDSIPTPVLAAFEGREPLWIVQVDAHMDWRDERNGERLGWSSTMRRASEMPWVKGIVQVGIRGVGSARPEDVRDAQAWGAKIITARDIHDNADNRGIARAIEAVPQGARCFITLDCDGLDPGVMPAVLAPAPGGLSYWQIVELFEGLGKRCTIVGADVVEYVPSRDVNGYGALVAGRIICNLLGILARSKNINARATAPPWHEVSDREICTARAVQRFTVAR